MKHLNTLTNGISGSYWLVFLTQWLFSVPFLLLLEIVTRPTALMLFFINMNVRVILVVWFIGLLGMIESSVSYSVSVCSGWETSIWKNTKLATFCQNTPTQKTDSSIQVSAIHSCACCDHSCHCCKVYLFLTVVTSGQRVWILDTV